MNQQDKDYTAVSRSIVDQMRAIGEPLTEGQQMILHGAVGGILLAIEINGVDIIVKNFMKRQKKQVDHDSQPA